MVALAGSLIYVGGMFLNDFCDVEFDREHRQERPIPSGRIRAGVVGWAAVACLGLGAVLFGSLGWGPGWLGMLLVGAVVVYDVTHKVIAFSPVTMALCRYLLFLAAGAAGADGVNGETVWCGLVLALYVVGLSYVARRESTEDPVGPAWTMGGSLLLLATPLMLAALMNPPYAWSRSRVVGPVFLLVVWMLRSLSHLYRGETGGARRTVGGLLAGIVLVDVLAVVPPAWPYGGVFLGLFLSALVLQRVVPAT